MNSTKYCDCYHWDEVNKSILMLNTEEPLNISHLGMLFYRKSTASIPLFHTQ